jgi:hypothetical protein
MFFTAKTAGATKRKFFVLRVLCGEIHTSVKRKNVICKKRGRLDE